MYHCEDAFTANPGPILVFDATVIQHGRFVEINSTAVDLFGKDYLISMEVVPARLPSNLMRSVT